MASRLLAGMLLVALAAPAAATKPQSIGPRLPLVRSQRAQMRMKALTELVPGATHLYVPRPASDAWDGIPIAKLHDVHTLGTPANRWRIQLKDGELIESTRAFAVGVDGHPTTS